MLVEPLDGFQKFFHLMTKNTRQIQGFLARGEYLSMTMCVMS